MKENKPKLWLCGMVRGDRSVLQNSIQNVYQYFDGLIFVVDDRAAKEDIDWLESIKGYGKIIVKKWVNDHAHTSNEVLFSGVMDFPDYFVWIDETDKLNQVFVRRLREDVEYWHKNNVGMVYLDHPFICRWHDGLRFVASPHWTIINIFGQMVDLSRIPGYRKENYVFNTRDILKSGFLSPAKYYYCYPNFSNHTQLLYAQFSEKIWMEHERLRLQFRFFCKYELGLEYTLESLITYMKENVGKYPEFFEYVLETEVNIKDLFRLFVLDQKWTDLVENRFNWSYDKWKETRAINQPKISSYIGVFNKYKISKGEQME